MTNTPRGHSRTLPPTLPETIENSVVTLTQPNGWVREGRVASAHLDDCGTLALRFESLRLRLTGPDVPEDEPWSPANNLELEIERFDGQSGFYLDNKIELELQ